MRGFDCGLARVGIDVGGKQALLHQQVHQRACLGGDFRQPGDTAARGSCVGIDPGQPGNETAAQQRQQRLALGGNARVGIGARKDALDGGVDGAADAAEVLVFGQGQVTVVAIVRVQAFQRERQQRQCILGAALLDVRHQRLDKLVVEFQLAARTRQPARRAADHLAVGAHRHRRQREQFALDAFQRGFGLQALVVVGADGDHADHGGIIVLQQVAEERQERLGLLARLGREQRLGLVDRQHDGVRTRVRAYRPARRGRRCATVRAALP